MKIKLVAIDTTEEHLKELKEPYGVESFPTIKVFGVGSTEAEDYEGERQAAGIVSYCEEKLSGPITVDEVVNQAALAACQESRLCIVSFLPHILDTKV